MQTLKLLNLRKTARYSRQIRLIKVVELHLEVFYNTSVRTEHRNTYPKQYHAAKRIRFNSISRIIFSCGTRLSIQVIKPSKIAIAIPALIRPLMMALHP